MKKKIVEFACNYQIASKFTSFIAVSKNVDDDSKNISIQKIIINTG
jgi:hypothetical protein